MESVFAAAPASPSSASYREALAGVEAGQSEHKASAASTSKYLDLQYIDTRSETSEWFNVTRWSTAPSSSISR